MLVEFPEVVLPAAGVTGAAGAAAVVAAAGAPVVAAGASGLAGAAAAEVDAVFASPSKNNLDCSF